MSDQEYPKLEEVQVVRFTPEPFYSSLFFIQREQQWNGFFEFVCIAPDKHLGQKLIATTAESNAFDFINKTILGVFKEYQIIAAEPELMHLFKKIQVQKGMP